MHPCFPGGSDGKAGDLVRSLGREDPLEKEMATDSSTFAWKFPWTEKPGGLPFMGSQKVGLYWATSLTSLTWLFQWVANIFGVLFSKSLGHMSNHTVFFSYFIFSFLSCICLDDCCQWHTQQFLCPVLFISCPSESFPLNNLFHSHGHI